MDSVITLQKARLLFKQEHLSKLLFLVLFGVSVFYLFWISRREKLNLPPCPPKLPVIGNLHLFGRELKKSLKILSDKYGPVMLLHVGSSPWLVVSSADTAKELMTCDVFAQRPQSTAAMSLIYGCCDIVHSPYGDYWRSVRKISVSELFSQKKVRDFRFAREDEVLKVVEKVRLLSHEGAVIDLNKISCAVSNNILSRCAFGRVYSGEEDGEEGFEELSRRSFDLLSTFCFRDMFPWLGWLDTVSGFNAKLKRAAKELDLFLDHVIEDHERLRSDDPDSDKADLVDVLLHVQKKGTNGIGLTRANLKAILLDMFIGGTDTTASAIERAMAELMKNPGTLKKAQEEVRRVVGVKSKMNETDMEQIDYLKCIIKETLRLHPVVIGRLASSSGITRFRGYDIPPNTKVMINAWAVHSDPRLWFKPEEFIPERFEYLAEFTGQSGQYIPFGAGKRSCPGTGFAVSEAEYVLANLLCWFDWRLPDGVRAEDLDRIDLYGGITREKNPLRLVARVPSTSLT